MTSKDQSGQPEYVYDDWQDVDEMYDGEWYGNQGYEEHGYEEQGYEVQEEVNEEEDVPEEEEEEEEEEPQRTIILPMKNYIPLKSLLPDPDEWVFIQKKYKRRRIQFLLLIFVGYLVLWSLNAPIYIVKRNRIKVVAKMRKSMLKRLEVGQPLPETCIAMDCVTVCPQASTTPDWYTLYELPYAALPQKKAYFSEALSSNMFDECYLTYWRSVPKKKRQFTNGRLVFHGIKIEDDNYECAQMKRKNGREIPVGNPHSCLTMSFHYPYGTNKTKLPIVVYIGGDYMLQHRPQLISSKMASELGLIYIALNYRLGVFGFSDFNTMNSKSNNAVRDIKKALFWIQENIHYFNGDSSSVTIYGENAGATIAVALLQLKNSADIVVDGRHMRLFTQMWISDGSVYIPKLPENRNPFHELVLNDVNLNAYCNEWKSNNPRHQTFNHPLRLKFHCLQNVPINVWLMKTPVEWLQSRHADQNILPEPDEKRFSIIKSDDDIVSNPIGSLYKDISDFSSTSIRDMPLVIYSSMGHECTKSCDSNKFDYWSFDKLYSTVLSEMDKFQSHYRQAPTGNVIWNLYQNYVKELVQDLEYSKKLSKFSYKAIYDEIRRDLRGNCLYSMYAKYLINSLQSKNYPVYRLLNRVPRMVYVDGSGARCDIPFYLIDSEFSCGPGTHPLYEKVNELEMKAILEIFSDFVRHGRIERATKMGFTDGFSTSIAYNIVDDLDLTSPAGREIAMFQLCEAWFSEDSGKRFAARHSRLN